MINQHIYVYLLTHVYIFICIYYNSGLKTCMYIYIYIYADDYYEYINPTLQCIYSWSKPYKQLINGFVFKVYLKCLNVLLLWRNAFFFVVNSRVHGIHSVYCNCHKVQIVLVFGLVLETNRHWELLSEHDLISYIYYNIVGYIYFVDSRSIWDW